MKKRTSKRKLFRIMLCLITAFVLLPAAAHAAAPLTAVYDSSYNIPSGVCGTYFNNSIKGAFSGGFLPCTYKLVSAPDWISLDSTYGKLDLYGIRPSTAESAGLFIVRATDMQDNSVDLTLQYGAVTESNNMIKAVTIYGLKAPAAGQAPDFSGVTVDEDAAYYVNPSEIRVYDSNYNLLLDGDKFTTGKYYIYEFVIKPQKGWYFPLRVFPLPSPG